MRRAPAALVVACALIVASAAACAADKKQASAPPALPEVPATLAPEEADAFLAKLTDAQVRELLSRELHAKAEKQARSAQPAPQTGFAMWLMQLRQHLENAETDAGRRRAALAQGAALLPGAIASGAKAQFAGKSGAAIVGQMLLVALVLLAGAAASWGARRALRRHGLEPQIATDAKLVARTSSGILRFALDLLQFAAFALVAIAVALAASQGGTPERSFLFTFVTGAIVVSATAVLFRAVLAPGAAPLRLLPLVDPAAAFLQRWLVFVWALMVFGSLTGSLLVRPDLAPEALAMLKIVIAGAPMVAALIVMILVAREPVAAALRAGGRGEPTPLRRGFAATWHVVAIAYLLLVGGMWAAGVLDGEPSRVGAAIASLAIVLAFPLLDHWVGAAIDDIVGDSATHSALRQGGVAGPFRWAMRVLLAVMLLTGVGELWQMNFFAWQAKLRTVLLGASFDLVAAFAVAVLGWQFIKVAIDRRLEAHEENGARIEPSARLRTLLPLARVFLVTALIVSTFMLVLAGLGVNIGPLLAGAGIIGLAIGFGAQTLVRDIITGVFLILDDAFRVGEYIQSGSYKGTVESIGLRSVKLRHHRGPIYVVPFGELRGVQNLARDWVIDKITVGVTYDTDIEKARKVVKKIGQELAADPEFAAEILTPLKMQGVEQFGDFDVPLRMKIMVKPGEKQFIIRRRAYAMIKQAFDANGIKFAYPTVQIAGGGSDAAVAAATRVTGLADDKAA